MLLVVDYLHTSFPDQEVILSTALPDCCSNEDLPFPPQGTSKDLASGIYSQHEAFHTPPLCRTAERPAGSLQAAMWFHVIVQYEAAEKGHCWMTNTSMFHPLQYQSCRAIKYIR